MRLKFIIIAVLAEVIPILSAPKIKIVASTSDLGAIAKEVGGSQVEVTVISPPRGNPHYLEVVPSHMVAVAKADLYLKVGMGLDYWADRIIDGSRNKRLLVVDCSKNIEKLEIPTGRIDALMGDIHPEGNPHYWLNPLNGLIIAQTITEALIQVDPSNSSLFMEAMHRFADRLKLKWEEWTQAGQVLRGLKIVTYHNSWPYFARAFGIEVIGFIEPYPGVEPTPSHIAQLSKKMLSLGVRVIGKEPYFESRTPRALASSTGATVIDLPPSVGSLPGIDNYFSLFDHLIGVLVRTSEVVP